MAATDATKFLNKTEYERTLARLRQYCDQKESSVTEEASFLYRKSPDVGNRDYFVAKSVKGKTLVWNQLVHDGNFPNGTDKWTSNTAAALSISGNTAHVSATSTPNASAGFQPRLYEKSGYQHEITIGHKYLLSFMAKLGSDSALVSLNFRHGSYAESYRLSTSWSRIDRVITANDASSYLLFWQYEAASSSVYTADFYIKDVRVFDLTLMFGAGNEPPTVEKFESMFPLPYYDYNPGELISFNTTGIQTVGRNLVDINTFPELTGRGEIDANGAWHLSSLSVGVTLWKNTVGYTGRLYYEYSCKYANGGNKGAGQRFKFVYTDGTSSTGVHSSIGKVVESFQTDYGTWTESWISDVFLYFLTDPQTDGTDGYIPYKSSTLDLSIPSMTSGGVQIFPDGMRSAGNVYDEAIVDDDGFVRKVVKRVITFNKDNLELSASQYTDSSKNYVIPPQGAYVGSSNSQVFVVSNGEYEATSRNDFLNKDKSICVNAGGNLLIRDTRFTGNIVADRELLGNLVFLVGLISPETYVLDIPIYVGSKFYLGGTQTVLPENTTAPTTTPFSGSFEYGRMPAMDVISLVNESSNMITSRYLPLTGGTLTGNLTTSGNITTSGYVAVGTGRNNGSYIGSDTTGNIYLHNFSGFPLVADGLVVRRGAQATTATLGSTTYPWAGIYSKTGNFSDAITLSGTTAATRRIYFGDTSHYLELDSTGFHFSHGVYSDSFISAGGVSQSGGSGGPIEINTDDFAEVDGVLQLADRSTSNGMGYIILRKDMSFASQITKTNTIYEVRYSFNLSGASVTIPSNCVLKFVGGMLVNGTVTGTNTKIDAPFVRIFSDNISLAGTWALDKFPVSWYGGEVNDSSVDISAVISKILEQFVTIFPGRNASGGHPYGGAKITLLEGAYYAKTPIVIYDYSPTSNGEGLNPMDGTSACEIEGSSKYGTYIHNSNTGDNFFLTNLRDGTHRHHWGLTLRFLTFIGGNGIKMVRPWDFHIEHCTFYNGGTAIKFFATVNTHINDCSFYNTVTAIEFDSSMGGGGVSTTFTIENCWIAWCRIGFKLSSIRTGDGFEFIIRNTIFEYCRASLQVQSISERNTLLIDECYFEGNPPDITTYGNTSTIEGVDCYFRHCLTDPIDYGFVKNGTCRFYWEGYMKPKLTLGDTTASKNVTIVVDGKTLYNNYDNHIVKTTGFFDNTPGVLYASEIGEAGAVRVNVRSGDDMNEGLWEWDGQGYSLSKEIAQTKAISYENSSFVFSKTSSDATFEAWLSGDKNTALVGPWIAKLQAKFSGFTGRETPLKKLLATLGAGNNSALWQKIKHLHFPVLALPSDGANVGYDLITDTVRTLNSYTIYANRGVYPTAGGGNIGALSVSGVSAANISFFGIVTYRADTLSIGSSAAECVYDQGYRINFNKRSMGFINASAEFGNFAYSDLNTEVPIAFAMSANTGSARTICKDSTSKSVSETAYGAGDSYQLSGQRSYAATSVFAICDGLTPAEALTASTALATFAIEFGILGNSNQ